jgi:hypothetical protein
MTLAELYDLVQAHGSESQIKDVHELVIEEIRRVVAENGDSVHSVTDALSADIYV